MHNYYLQTKIKKLIKKILKIIIFNIINLFIKN